MSNQIEDLPGSCHAASRRARAVTERRLRAFIAIDLPEEVTRALEEVTRRLQETGIDGLRAVRPEGIHLTLKFLGSVAEHRLHEIVSAVRDAAAGHHSFQVRAGAAGVFPSVKRPRVLWVGIEGGGDRLPRLQGDIDSALSGLGFAQESRPYRPHLTIARIADRTSARNRRRAVEALGVAGPIMGMRIPVRSVSLIESVLRPEGAIYARRARAPLAEIR